MNRTLRKVVLSCFLGAGIGALIALELSHFLWWIGMIIGGIVGVVSYAWKEILQAAPEAWRRALVVFKGWKLPEWQTMRKVLKGIFWYCFNDFCFTVWMGVLIFLVAFGFHDVDKESFSPDFWIPISILGVMCFPMMFADHDFKLTIDPSISYVLFPPLTLFWHLPRGLIWLAVRLPAAACSLGQGIVACARGLVVFARFLRRFFWELFLLVHSREFFICGFDSFLGAGIGYFAGSVIIGALSGAVLGYVNYFFVTEKWLKPKGYLPAKAA